MAYFPRWKIFVIIAVCLASIYVALPNFMPGAFSNAKKLNLGLDLRGGSYLLLEVGFDEYLKGQMESLVDEIRLKLREKNIGYTGLSSSTSGVSISLRDTNQQNQLREIIRGISNDLEIDNQDGASVIRYRESALKSMRLSLVDQSMEIVRRRVDETGTREPIIQRQGETRVLLQVPGLQNASHLKDLLGRTAQMTFHLMDPQDPFPTAIRAPAPGTQLLKGAKGEQANQNNQHYYMIQRRPILGGDMLVHATASFEQGQPVVSFRFNNQGGRIFGDITKRNVGKPFAIVLDNEVISAPVIREPITGGSGMISGNFSVQSASDLALLLRAGALPAPLKILEERSVGPSLGADSIKAGSKAGVIGLILVMCFMVIGYGLFGFFSIIALVINLVMVIAILSLFQATLTMPGIAGLVLTLGMAVDANVLIYERMREEIRMGKTPIAVIDQGFSRAFATIMDSNVTTLIAALLLYILGTGPVKGFAVTLAIGIVTSMFTAVMLTRLLIAIWMKQARPKAIPI